MQFANKDYTNWYLGKIFNKKRKDYWHPVLFGNNQIELWCLTKRKTPAESIALNVKSAQYTK